MDFKEFNIFLRNFIDSHITDINTKNLCRVEWINAIDRKQLAEEFVMFYFSDANKGEKRCKAITYDIKDNCGYTCLLQKRCWLEKDCYVLEFKRRLLIYTALQIDIFIPEEYFLIYNSGKGIAESDLLELFQSVGKNNYTYTKELEYVYEHGELTEEQENPNIEENATEKQLSYLSSILSKQNYCLISKIGLTKNNTNNLIKYLNGTTTIKPEIFDLYIAKRLP